MDNPMGDANIEGNMGEQNVQIRANAFYSLRRLFPAWDFDELAGEFRGQIPDTPT